MCALEMKKKISKARVQTPNDIKSLSLFLSFFRHSEWESKFYSESQSKAEAS